MRVDDPPTDEDGVRRRMRRQQFANTFVIMLFALGIVTLSAFLVGRWHPWQGALHHAARPMPKVAAAPAKAPVVEPPPSAPATVSAAAAVAPGIVPKPAPKPKPAAPKRPAPPPARTVRPAPPPPSPESVQPAPPARSPYDHPGAGAAKRVLVSIKCLDGLAYEGEMHGRQYFSARCENGGRRSVSCAGAGCRIEYAPPPSHLP